MAEPSRTPYQVIARRFRPKSFAEVVGQGEILGSLRKALTSGRIPHAFLFAGGRGVGKTTLARILARCLNCAKGPTADPCGTCDPCRSILEDRNADFVEIDAASHNGVDNIRELREHVGIATMGSRYKVFLFDEVHMLSRGAFNAFLKTLEEPPPNVVFVMATTELNKVPDTIRSRCQVLRFAQVGEPDMVERLARICAADGVRVDADVLAEIARASRGGMRDAETALERVLAVARDQTEAFGIDAFRQLFHRVGFERAREVVLRLCVGEAGPALAFAADVAAQGGDEREVLGEVLDVLRAQLLLLVDGVDSVLVSYDGDRAGLLAAAKDAGLERLDAMIQAGLIGRERMRDLEDRRLVLEVSLVRMAQAGRLPLLADLANAIAAGTPLPAMRLAPAGVPQGSGIGAGAPVAVGAGLPPTGGGDLLSRLRAWMERRDPKLVMTLAFCQLEELDGGKVVRIRFVTDKKLHRDRLMSDAVQQVFRQGLAEILGRDVRVAVVDAAALASSAAPTSTVAPPSPTAPAAEVPESVRRVAKRFDGRILDSEDPANP